MKRIIFGLLLALSFICLANATTNATITVTCATCTPVGGDLKICADAAGLNCGSFTVSSDATGKLPFFGVSGCDMGQYTITISSPNLTSDTATLNVVAGPLVRLLVTTGKNQSVPIKGGTTSIVVAGGDACGNIVPLP